MMDPNGLADAVVLSLVVIVAVALLTGAAIAILIWWLA